MENAFVAVDLDLFGRIVKSVPVKMSMEEKCIRITIMNINEPSLYRTIINHHTICIHLP